MAKFSFSAVDSLFSDKLLWGSLSLVDIKAYKVTLNIIERHPQYTELTYSPAYC
jgi:hypothetical protein